MIYFKVSLWSFRKNYNSAAKKNNHQYFRKLSSTSMIYPWWWKCMRHPNWLTCCQRHPDRAVRGRSRTGWWSPDIWLLPGCASSPTGSARSARIWVRSGGRRCRCACCRRRRTRPSPSHEGCWSWSGPCRRISERFVGYQNLALSKGGKCH